MNVAILGGTGPEGLGLGARLAKAGNRVIVGSRSAERAAEAARSLRERVPSAEIDGGTNVDAASRAETVFVAVPYAGLGVVIDTCGDHLTGKVVVDIVVPLRMRKGFADLEPVAEGSASERIQASLPNARVVSAFKSQSAIHLLDLEHPVEGDVIISGNDPAARELVAGLVRGIPDLRPVDAGDVRNSRAVEHLTALLVNLNRRHRAHTSFRITGL